MSSHSVMPPVLIIDDEDNIRKIIAFQLEQDGIICDQASSAEAGIEKLQKQPYSCVISDVRMPGQDGLSVLQYVKLNCPRTPLILLTAYGTVDMAVQALKNGAFDFLSKPFEQTELIRCVRSAQSTFQIDQPHPTAFPSLGLHQESIRVGNSRHFEEVSRFIEQAAHSPCHLIITGEMGTGKELVARAIHAQSLQKDFSFIRFHCGSHTEESFEGDLFGYEKGAHPTLLSGKPGKLELADQGTLLIEEIQRLPQSIQLRLLEFIQTGTVERIGALTGRRAHVRIIATSRERIRPGEHFREDLFLALDVMSLSILPLRERMDDLEPICRHLLKTLSPKLGKAVMDLDPNLLQFFKRYAWPGNVRELENVLERMIVQSKHFSLRIEDVPADFKKRVELPPSLTLSNTEDAVRTAVEQTPAEGGLKALVKNATQNLEKSVIIDALRSTSGNVTHAAKKLEISRKSLQNKMKEFSIRELME